MSEPRRALWLVPVAPIGGVARHVLDATRAGVPGWTVTVLCPPGALADRLRAQGTSVIAAPFGPDAGVLRSRRTLAEAVREVAPALVHSHLAYADIVNAGTPLPTGVRRVTTEHGIAAADEVYHRSSAQARVMALVHRARFPRFAGVIAVSSATRDAMVARWRVRQPITVIPNGVDLPPGVRRRDGGIPRTLRILALSRLAPEKRIESLIDAFPLVRNERPDATLTIAGEGPSRAGLEARSAALGVEVAFPGFSDPEQAMAAADVVVQLSVWENCSYTLLDAVARGLRVVASDVGGNRDIVDGASLIPDVDPATVARAILRSPHDATTRRAISVADMCARIADVYATGEAA